jgi:hypothetical protein
VSLYSNIRYARAENVKASSTLIAADQIVDELSELGLINKDTQANRNRYDHEWAYLAHNDSMSIHAVARDLAKQRSFPVAMAGVNCDINGIHEPTLADLNANNDSSTTEM